MSSLCGIVRRGRRPFTVGAAAVADRTPADRDRALDGLRALALLAVPLGHWLIGGFTLDTGGALHNASLLTAVGGLALGQLGPADARHLLSGRRARVGAVPPARHRAGRVHPVLAVR